VFHFVWSRIGHKVRSSFENLILEEFAVSAPGELGWSAESMRLRLTEADRLNRTRRWKDYLSESFCDTAGWLFGSARRYSEMTLGRTQRDGRRRWFRENVAERPLSV